MMVGMMTITAPSHPIAAVTHTNPYPFYADLVAHRPFYYDEPLKLWVASSAEAVTAVLTHPAARVRPPAEPVPTPLRGSPAGDFFGALVRMNDGERRHNRPREAMIASIDGISRTVARIDAIAEQHAQRLIDAANSLNLTRSSSLSRSSSLTDSSSLTSSSSVTGSSSVVGSPNAASDAGALMQLAFALPTHVIGSLLGIPETDLNELARLVTALSACLAGTRPTGEPLDADVMSRGQQAARQLRDRFREMLRSPVRDASRIAEEARHVDWDDEEAIVSNAVSLLTQAQDATAALIMTTLLTLARMSWLRDAVEYKPALLADIVEEVERFDSPVQNTRRFLAEPATILGQPLPAGATILVVLGAANRDPAVNPEPASFALTRQTRQLFTFGVGQHACIGQALATSIARGGVARLLASGVDPARLRTEAGYRPSPNIRIPLLTWRS
jgi:cytochrome P450